MKTPPKSATKEQISLVMSVLGARGGAAKRGMKGFATMTLKRRKEISAMAVAARKAKRKGKESK